jgi:hypothetical protein
MFVKASIIYVLIEPQLIRRGKSERAEVRPEWLLIHGVCTKMKLCNGRNFNTASMAWLRPMQKQLSSALGADAPSSSSKQARAPLRRTKREQLLRSTISCLRNQLEKISHITWLCFRRFCGCCRKRSIASCSASTEFVLSLHTSSIQTSSLRSHSKRARLNCLTAACPRFEGRKHAGLQ